MQRDVKPSRVASCHSCSTSVVNQAPAIPTAMMRTIDQRAVAAIRSRQVASPVRVDMNGGQLVIAWEPGGSVKMRGGATHVFSGELDVEALS